MKRSATVTPAKEQEESFNEYADQASQFQSVLAELRRTSEGIGRIEERLTQTDAKIADLEACIEASGKATDAKIEAGSKATDAKIEASSKATDAKIEAGSKATDAKIDATDAKIDAIDNKLSVFINDRQPFGSADDSAQQRDDDMKIALQLSALHIKNKKEEAAAIAEELYSYHSSNHRSNLMLVDKLMGEKAEFFDPINKICPPFNILMSHVMVNKIGVSVKSVRHTSKISNWSEREAMRAGSSFAVFLRKRKTGDAALDAWRLHYVQLKKLFDEAEGCEEFMLVFANNLLRDR